MKIGVDTLLTGISIPVHEQDHLVKMNYFGLAYIRLGDLVSLQKLIEDTVRQNDNPYLFYRAACLYAQAKLPKEALTKLELALNEGFFDLRLLKDDPDLQNIRQEETYYALLLRYFPGIGC